MNRLTPSDPSAAIMRAVNERVRAARELAGPSYLARQLAEKVIVEMRAEDPELLDAWLRLRAAEILAREVAVQDGLQRRHNRTQASRSVFRDAALQAQQGRPEALTSWLSTRWTLQDGSRVPLASMRKDDLEYVARGYETTAEHAGMHGAFMRALANAVDGKIVGDVFTEEEITALWNSISR